MLIKHRAAHHSSPPAYPAKRAEAFAARRHPQGRGRGSLPLRRPGGPHRGGTEAHTTGPEVPTVVRPPHPHWPYNRSRTPTDWCRGRRSLPGDLAVSTGVGRAGSVVAGQRPPLSGEPTRQNLARRERFHTPLDTRDEPVHQWEIVIYKSRPRPLTLSRS